MDSIKSVILHHHNKAFIYSIFLGLQPKGSYVLDPLSPKSLRTPLLYGLPQIHIQHLPLPLTTKFLHTPFSYSTLKMDIPNLSLPHSPKLPDIPLFYVIRKIMHPLSSTLLRNQNVQIARSTVAYRFTIKTY